MLLLATVAGSSAATNPGPKWATSWTGSAQGPYPAGNPSAQPNLSLAFPSPNSGARDQTFRLIVKPGTWGRQTRIRLSNAFGTRAVTFDSVFVGLQMSGAALVPGTNRPLTFGRNTSITIAPGESAWSDPASLPFVRDPASAELIGRKLAVSFHIVGESGPMTWHAKALTSSYLTMPGAGAKGKEQNETAFPIATTSWYFVDALDMMVPADTQVIVAFGDSITDGTASTLNGDDRWPDVLSRRLQAVPGRRYSVINAGIGGNQVAGPPEYSAQSPFAGGPSALQRLDRDVLTLSGVSAVIWLEGINDLARNGGANVTAVISAMQEGVRRMRARTPGIKVIGATLTPSLGSTIAGYGSPELDLARKQLNDFIRTGRLFDSVADFDQVIIDPQTGGMRGEFVPDNTIGGTGDKLHPNRLGYQAMGMAIDISSFATKAAPRR